MDIEMDHYVFLGLPSGEEGSKPTEKEIAKAYRLKALELHPDKRPNDPNALANFQKLQTSYKILKDEKARKLFDDLLRLKHQKLQRQSQQDSERRRTISDLEERELIPFYQDRSEEENIAMKLREEVSRIHATQSNKTTEESPPNEETSSGNHNEIDKEKTVKVSWKKFIMKYNVQRLRKVFETFGEVKDVIITSTQRKGSALVVMATKEAAAAAIGGLCGDETHHLVNEILAGTSSQKKKATRKTPSTCSSQPVKKTRPANQNREQAKNKQTLETHGILSGRSVKLTDTQEDIATRQIFVNKGWETFLNLSGNTQVDNTVEFYASYKFDAIQEKVDVCMFQKIYSWTLAEFSTILDLPRGTHKLYMESFNLNALPEFVTLKDLISTICHDGVDPNTTMKLQVHNLKKNVKFWNKIVLHNIIPRGGNFSNVTALQALVLYCLVTDTEVDIGYLVARHMNDIVSSRRAMPYGLLLNRLFTHLGLPRGRTDKESTAIDDVTRKRMKNTVQDNTEIGEGSRAANDDVAWADDAAQAAKDARTANDARATNDVDEPTHVHNLPRHPPRPMFHPLTDDGFARFQHEYRLDQQEYRQHMVRLENQLTRMQDDMRSFFEQFRQQYPFPPPS